MKKTPALELQNVSKEYVMGESIIHALREINLTIHMGEYISILGPSGSGKSTLLHILGLLDTPTKGKVFVEEKEVSRISDDERAYIRGKKIGFVFQMYNLVPSLTAIENVMLPMMIYDVPKDIREMRAYQLLEQLGMENRAHHKPNELSGGQRQRVAIARALANDPAVILADEPTGNLDSKSGDEVVEIFNELNKKGKSLIIVTHDNDVASNAKRIIRIRDGRIVSKGEYDGKE
ncbi:MAG: ABC transporter ATP-binding protein [Candidatus Micrarchaeia archaeon]